LGSKFWGSDNHTAHLWLTQKTEIDTIYRPKSSRFLSFNFGVSTAATGVCLGQAAGRQAEMYLAPRQQGAGQHHRSTFFSRLKYFTGYHIFENFFHPSLPIFRYALWTEAELEISKRKSLSGQRAVPQPPKHKAVTITTIRAFRISMFENVTNLKKCCSSIYFMRRPNPLAMGWKTEGSSSNPGKGKIFSPLHVIQTGSGGPPNLISNGYRGLFPRG
jgi:hypothetical protein